MNYYVNIDGRALNDSMKFEEVNTEVFFCKDEMLVFGGLSEVERYKDMLQMSVKTNGEKISELPIEESGEAACLRIPKDLLGTITTYKFGFKVGTDNIKIGDKLFLEVDGQIKPRDLMNKLSYLDLEPEVYEVNKIPKSKYTDEYSHKYLFECRYEYVLGNKQLGTSDALKMIAEDDDTLLNAISEMFQIDRDRITIKGRNSVAIDDKKSGIVLKDLETERGELLDERFALLLDDWVDKAVEKVLGGYVYKTVNGLYYVIKKM
ncbi:hypothetical protein [Clostridium sp.]|uniref:hypothetical protein n=1 Tax=Clostridium sp. TaxID=1506 RepID=UPI001B4C1716|nr:hypothetical protein [Clostridium sp.]MBP3917198.1 hypothetical protein [Clostridium sp.]